MIHSIQLFRGFMDRKLINGISNTTIMKMICRLNTISQIHLHIHISNIIQQNQVFPSPEMNDYNKQLNTELSVEY
jgi:CDP-diacylglycerol pyrophosphatase